MRILVPFKRVPDAESGESGGSRINPFDEIALEEAIRIRERGEASEIVGVTVASDAANDEIRTALAMGLDRVIRVDDGRDLDPYAVSRILASVARRETPDLILMGKQSVDDDSAQTGQMLAGLLGWPQATCVSEIVLQEGLQEAVCKRETDRGLETISVRLPAVVTADLRLNEPRYVGLAAILKARSRPIEVRSCDELGMSVRPRSACLSITPAPRRQGGIRMKSVDELVVRLREHDRVL